MIKEINRLKLGFKAKLGIISKEAAISEYASLIGNKRNIIFSQERELSENGTKALTKCYDDSRDLIVYINNGGVFFLLTVVENQVRHNIERGIN